MIQSVSMRNAGTLQTRLGPGHQKTALFDAPLQFVGIDQAFPAPCRFFQPIGLGNARTRLDFEDNFVAIMKAYVLQWFEYSICKASPDCGGLIHLPLQSLLNCTIIRKNS